MRPDYCGDTHRRYYSKSNKANATEDQNADFQEGYALGIKTYNYDAESVLKAEIEFRKEFKLTANRFNELKRGFWASRSQMTVASVRKR